jgi:hypothetical protein
LIPVQESSVALALATNTLDITPDSLVKIGRKSSSAIQSIPSFFVQTMELRALNADGALLPQARGRSRSPEIGGIVMADVRLWSGLVPVCGRHLLVALVSKDHR